MEFCAQGGRGKECDLSLSVLHSLRTAITRTTDNGTQMTALDLSSEIHTFIRKHQVFPHLNFNILGWESMTFGQVTEEAGVISFVP